MNHFQSYFNTAISLIKVYNGTTPLNNYLKQYFSANKKFGSKDRKYITHLCYCYCRSGYALQELTTEEKMKAALFLCNTLPGNWNILFEEKCLLHWNADLKQRINFIRTIHPTFTLNSIFPFTKEISETIDASPFAQSHLIQPDLFVRVRPGKKDKVIEKLKANEISYTNTNGDCIAINNQTKLYKVLELNKEAVIQDYSSQRISEFLDEIKLKIKNSQLKVGVWDCCAGSGGKSILAYDILGKDIKLTATDIRESIIHNLKKRFTEAGIKNYTAHVEDVTNLKSEKENQKFDVIICDAPCTGSGTWSRTPEQLYFFKEEKINHHVQLQKKIVSNAVHRLKAGGYFLYITCSVFKKENEEIVDYIKEHLNLTLIKMEVLKGYDKKANTMFAALFTASQP